MALMSARGTGEQGLERGDGRSRRRGVLLVASSVPVALPSDSRAGDEMSEGGSRALDVSRARRRGVKVVVQDPDADGGGLVALPSPGGGDIRRGFSRAGGGGGGGSSRPMSLTRAFGARLRRSSELEWTLKGSGVRREDRMVASPPLKREWPKQRV